MSPHLFAIYLDDVASCLTIRQRCHIVLYADDILIIALSLTELQRLVNACESELCSLDMLINATKSACMRVGPRYNVVCSSIVAGNQNLPWVDKMRYLGIFFINSRNFRCSLDHAKLSFHRSINAVFGKVGRLASEDVVLHLVDSKCMPILLYATEVCPLSQSDIFGLCHVPFSHFLFKMNNNDIINDCCPFSALNCQVNEYKTAKPASIPDIVILEAIAKCLRHRPK